MLHEYLYGFHMICLHRLAACSVKLSGDDHRHIIHEPVHLIHILHVRNKPGNHPVHQNNCFHLQGKHFFQQPDLLLHPALLGLIKHHGSITRLLCGFFAIKKQLCIIRIADIRHNNSDQPAPGLRQSLRQRIGPEIIFLSQSPNPLLCLRPHPAAVVQRS